MSEEKTVLEKMMDMEAEELGQSIPKLPSITFSYPYGNGFSPEWLESYTYLLLHETSKSKEERILGSLLKAGSCYVDSNRDKLAIDFNNLTQDDWLLMIDPDIQFQPDILEKFAAHIQSNPEAKIIAGRVNLLNGLPVFYKIDKVKVCNVHQPFPFEGLKEFDLLGTGIICIAREVFVNLHKHFKNPHYFNKIITNSGLCLGDDFSFCLRATEIGYKLFGAWDIEGIHWKSQPCRNAYLNQEQLEIRTK